MDAILARRSIRKYTDQGVSDAVVQTLLQAAMAAPSAGNEQPWHFVVIRDRQILTEITTFHPYAGMLKECPLAILVCGDEMLEQFKGFWIQDCSAATENLLIAAQSIGLGAVWLGIYPIEERVAGIRKLLGIPAHVHPFALISVGYPAEEKQPANRYKAERVHTDQW
jgi:nitroreductase